MKKIITLLLVSFWMTPAITQTDEQTALTKQLDSLNQPIAKTWSIGIGFGVMSVPSVQVQYRFLNRFIVQGSYDLAAYNIKNIVKEVAGYPISFDFSPRLSKWTAQVFIQPLPVSWLHLQAGVAIFPNKTLTTKITTSDTIRFAGITILPGAVGNTKLTLGYNTSISPYLGVALGRPIPIRKHSVCFSAGAYYGGKFKLKTLEIDSPILTKENEENLPILERNLNRLPGHYRLIPDIKISWMYTL
jgi:hypothetical protein